MSYPPTYTPLESLLLFQSILSQGIDTAAFARISEQLRNNGLVKGDLKYDPTRLSPEALQQFFFRLFQEELKGETTPAGDGSTSPNSKKRKIASPPLPSLKEVYENIDKIPVLVNRLYSRYRDNIVQQIREDEVRYDTVQNEIHIIEKSENARLARLATQNGAPTQSPREVKPSVTTARLTPASLPTPAAVAAANKRPTSTTPIVPPRLPPTPAIAPPSHLTPGTTPARPAPSATQPTTAPSSVLQAPVGVPQQPARVLQVPPQPPKVPISPRPETITQAKATPSTPQPPTTPGQSTLKWEKPYQPPQVTQTPPPRQTVSPAPKPTTPHLPPQQKHVPAQAPWQGHQAPYSQQQPHVQTPVPAPTPPAAQTPAKPVLVPPQTSAQSIPQLQQGPPRPAGTAPSPQPRQPVKTPVLPPQHRPVQAQPAQAAQQPRPIAASPTPGPSTPAPTQVPPQVPSQRWPAGHAQHGLSVQTTPIVPSASPTPAASHQDKPYASPYATHPPRPAIPEHMIRHAAAGTPLATRRTSVLPPQPQTPIQNTPMTVLRGLGTKWAAHPSPSTPGGMIGEPQSPAYEPMSPPLRAAALPRPTPKTGPKKQVIKPAIDTPSGKPVRGRPARQSQKQRGTSATPSAEASRRSQSVASQNDDVSTDLGNTASATKVKHEDATPRPHEETGDTTADESVAGRGNLSTPKASSRNLKRKRNESPSNPTPPLAAQVLWTRGFTKVSSSALDQISSHRDANMFATALREKDAPNYRQIVLQPQDITSIRSAIKQGNKAAVAAANSLPGGDPGTASVYLPYSEDIVPPKGIINSAQLERELVHMFCNAIMYNPDPDRGPGSTFMKRSQEDEEEVFGYRLDENGIVRNTQSMFLEVEKLLGDLRSAEKDRTAPPLSTPRPASVATPAEDTAEEEEEAGEGTAKRRRVRA
ncbi:unnamed protein product [Clonostachys solani]|uniref:Bromo domain-containing protein n=1 Tax=Clonostachys solani TaxID=160281 RepID=A0A9N9ZPW1_9HYPO|nr:unnamed protein product [Clonostachys solani]